LKEQDILIKFHDSLEGIVENSQIKYLVSEYLEIEKIWTKFFNSLETINLVIVAEAPLNSNQYIFNEDSKNTPFLYKSTLEKCMKAYKNNIRETETSKIDLMRDLGIIIIEAYPYSLDPKKHKNNFGNLDLESRKVLLKESCSWHLDKKLETIKGKTTAETIFGYRYDRNKEFINLMDKGLKFTNLSDAGKKPAYGAIDEGKLIKIFADLNK
tara:strand:+ start:484 stop:1119 length:636 start_codon:yes stop_codon:yes gene_type:complete